MNDFCMLNEQKFVLKQAIDLIKKQKIEALLISGDVFDRAIPPISALEVFNDFLKEINSLKVKTFIISGNHDNMDRLAYLSEFLENSNIFISKSFTGEVQNVELNEEINIYLMPYLYPALIKKYYPDSEIKNYNDAIKLVVDDIKLDKNKFNILLAHQFVLGNETLEFSSSEQKAAGGVDEVNYKIFEKFDYVALGHLHCPQKCAKEYIRYAGSILKYSFSEINQVKKFVVLNVSDKKLNLEFFPIEFLHEMKEYCGFIDEFLNKDFYQNIDKEDYIHFILKDEYVLDAKKKLSLIYPNIMLLEFDNSFTRNLKAPDSIQVEKDIYEHFCDFYQMQTKTKLEGNKQKIVLDMMEDNQCAH